MLFVINFGYRSRFRSTIHIRSLSFRSWWPGRWATNRGLFWFLSPRFFWYVRQIWWWLAALAGWFLGGISWGPPWLFWFVWFFPRWGFSCCACWWMSSRWFRHFWQVPSRRILWPSWRARRQCRRIWCPWTSPAWIYQTLVTTKMTKGKREEHILNAKQILKLTKKMTKGKALANSSQSSIALMQYKKANYHTFRNPFYGRILLHVFVEI